MDAAVRINLDINRQAHMPFGLGFGETLLIFFMLVLLFGPGKMPEIGAALGKGIRDFKDSLNGLGDNERPRTTPAPVILPPQEPTATFEPSEQSNEDPAATPEMEGEQSGEESAGTPRTEGDQSDEEEVGFARRAEPILGFADSAETEDQTDQKEPISPLEGAEDPHREEPQNS